MQLAQNIQLPGGQNIVGPLPAGRFTTLASVVNQAIPYLFSIAGVILLVYTIWGGFDFLTSMGDPKKAEAGKNKITSAIIGFIIIFVSYWLVEIVKFLLRV